MNDDRRLSADRVPTLTEVVELGLLGDSLPTRGAGLMPDEAPDEAPPEPVEFSLDIPVLPVRGYVDTPEPGGSDDAGLPCDERAVWSVPEAEPVADEAVGDEVAAVPESVANANPAAEAEAQPRRETSLRVAVVPAPATPEVDLEALVARVLAELTPRIDMLLESRLREALAPALARAADSLIRDTRTNLSGAVRELVQETVARALQRRSDL